MRIGFDAKRAFHTKRGLGSYARTLISNLASMYPDDELFLFTPPLKDNGLNKWHLPYKNITVVTPKSGIGKLIPTLWRSCFLASEVAKYNLDVYHGLSHEIPPSIEKLGIKTVVTIHDLIYVKFPQFYNLVDRFIYERKFASSIKRSDRIVAICNQTKYDIIDHFGADENKIEVVYQSCNDRFFKETPIDVINEVKERLHLPEKYLFYLGAIVPNKNIELLLNALATFPIDARPHLVVAGGYNAHLPLLKNLQAELKLEHDVTWLMSPTDEDLPALYAGATAFCFPSFYEGFGIPVIEALCSTTAVITSKQGALMEAAGDGGIFVDPNSVDQCVNAITSLWNDEELRTKLAEKGKKHVEIFLPKNVTAKMHDLYLRLCNER